MIVGFAISGAAALWVRSSYKKYSKQMSASGLTGAQTARMLLDRNGLTNVRVEPVAGQLTDHYDPRGTTVRLSEGNFAQNSIAAVSVAAHEVGHAIQDASGYLPMKFRAGLFPVVAFSSQIWLPLFIMGIFIGAPLFIPVGGRPVCGGPGVSRCDATGRDQRFHPRLRSPDPLRDTVWHRGRRHKARAYCCCLHLHRSGPDCVLNPYVFALVEPERVRRRVGGA